MIEHELLNDGPYVPKWVVSPRIVAKAKNSKRSGCRECALYGHECMSSFFNKSINCYNVIFVRNDDPPESIKALHAKAALTGQAYMTRSET